jgi:flagellar basal body-associated protein FliL
MSEAKSEAAKAPEAAAAAPAAGGGAKAWLPLVLNVVLMPVIAYATVTFLLVPKLKARTEPAEEHAEEPAEKSGHGDKPGGHGEKSDGGHGAKPAKAEKGGHGAKGAKGKVTVPLAGKVLVNVAGTAGTRFLVANLTLVGANADLEGLVKKHDRPSTRCSGRGR